MVEKSAQWLEQKILDWLQEQNWPYIINSQDLIKKMAELLDFGDKDAD